MHNETKQKSVREHVLEVIKENQIAMRPKWIFILHGIIAILAGVIFGLALLYLASFIIFSLRQTGIGFGPEFGPRGWLVFFRSLPWLLVIVALLFAVVLEILVRRYSFAYRRPLLYSIGGIIVITLVGGFLLADTSFHRKIAGYSKHHSLPFGTLYMGFEENEFPNVIRALVSTTTENGLLVQTLHGQVFQVLISDETRLPFERVFNQGDRVLIFGDQDGSSTIRAFGIRKHMNLIPFEVEMK